MRMWWSHGTNPLFRCSNMKGLAVGVNLRGWRIPAPPHPARLAGATVIVNCSIAMRPRVRMYTAMNLSPAASLQRLVCGYVYANAGDGESTRTWCCSAARISLRRTELSGIQRRLFHEHLRRLWTWKRHERRRITTFPATPGKGGYMIVDFELYPCRRQQCNQTWARRRLPKESGRDILLRRQIQNGSLCWR